MDWNELSTTLDAHSTHELFRVIHPYHPLVGREFQVADWRCNWADDRVYYRDPTGVLNSIPSHWTDLVAPDPFVVMADGRSHFRAEELMELARLIESLKR